MLLNFINKLKLLSIFSLISIVSQLVLNFINKLKLLGIFSLIFFVNEVALNNTIQDISGVIKIYERNIDWINIIIIVIIGVIILLSVLLLVAYAILLERKVLGSIQKRRGPNLVGIFGLLQPIADALKLIVKETIIPVASNRIIFIIAPLLTLILSLLNWSIIPFSVFAVLADIRLSVLMFFAISSLTVYGIIMSGWSSNSKYAFLGALRAAAQVIAYEVSIGLTLIYILVQSADLNYFGIISTQKYIWNIVPCFIFFFLFFISTLAETNRPPFDLPEAEAELVSGYNVEYSAMSFGFFFLGEYVSIWTVCCLNVILFWGGYFTFTFISIFIYSLKVIIFVITFIWVRGSLPRYRYDQLMRLGWKILLPISLGFVIFYSGVHLANLLDQLIEAKRILYNLESNVSNLNIVGSKFYVDELSYEKFHHDRNWHNFNLWEWDMYGWDWTQFGRPNILRTLNHIYSYEDIWNNWYRLRLISNYYLDIKHDITYININPEKYSLILEHVLHIKRKYSLEYILEKRWEYLNGLYKEFNEKLNESDLNSLILNLEKDYNDILLSEKHYNSLSLEEKWKALDWELIRNYDYIETQRLNDLLSNNFWDYVIADLFKILDSELPNDIEAFWNDAVLRAEIAYVFDLEGLSKEEFIKKMLWYIKAKDLEILDILGDIVEERDEQLYNEWFELEEKKKTLNQILFELIEREGI